MELFFGLIVLILIIFSVLILPVCLIEFIIWAWEKGSIRSCIPLDRWFSDDGFTPVEHKTAFFKKGPYWKASRGQRVLRVAVLDANKYRTYWVGALWFTF